MDILESIRKSEFKSVKNVARHLGVDHSNLFHFIAKRYFKIGKRTRKTIRDFFRQQHWIPTPAPKIKCICSICGREHVRRQNENPLVTRLADLFELIESLKIEMMYSSNDNLRFQLDDAVKELIKVIRENNLFKSSTQEPERVSKD